MANPMLEITPTFPGFAHRCMWMTECGNSHARDYSNISRVCPPVYVRQETEGEADCWPEDGHLVTLCLGNIKFNDVQCYIYH